MFFFFFFNLKAYFSPQDNEKDLNAPELAGYGTMPHNLPGVNHEKQKHTPDTSFQAEISRI